MILADLLANIDTILTRITPSQLSRYDQLQRSLLTTNVSLDIAFQKTFNGYYRMQRRPPDWYPFYFSILEREKHNRAISFRDVLEEVYRTRRSVEPAFSSKLVATIRPELPVYDSFVRENLALVIPKQYEPSERRVEKFVGVYDVLCSKMAELVKSAAFGELRRRVDERHPDYSHLTDIKKLDLLLWQFRQGQAKPRPQRLPVQGSV